MEYEIPVQDNQSYVYEPDAKTDAYMEAPTGDENEDEMVYLSENGESLVLNYRDYYPLLHWHRSDGDLYSFSNVQFHSPLSPSKVDIEYNNDDMLSSF